MDMISEVLQTVRLTGGVFFDTKYAAPWSISSPAAAELAKIMRTKAECVSQFHLVSEGKCRYILDSYKSFQADEGNFIIFPHCNAHTMCSEADTYSKPIDSILPFEDCDNIQEVHYGGNGKKCQVLCGFVHNEQKLNPLIGSLPDVLVVSPPESGLWKHAAEKDVALLPNMIQRKSGDWVDQTLNFLAREAKSKKPGSAMMMIRLAEILFVEVLRQYIKKFPKESGGWLAGIKDHQVGLALRLLHEHPEHQWDVDELANAVGLSRSSLGQRFKMMVGEPPISYLTSWRMQLAKSLLLKPSENVASIAAKVGYDSDVAFNRAFKRYKGEPPVSWRKRALKLN